MDRNRADAVAAALFLVWLVLLLPWLLIAPLSFMAFDGDSQLLAYTYVGLIWTYPLSVGLVWWFRDQSPLIAFFPFVNIATCILLALLEK
jgi:hypothetical protein